MICCEMVEINWEMLYEFLGIGINECFSIIFFVVVILIVVIELLFFVVGLLNLGIMFF